MAVDQVFAKIAELLWTGGLAATPLAVVVALVCRSKRVGPATRHMLWLAVLVSFMTPAIGALIWKPHWFRSDRLMAAAESARWISPSDEREAMPHEVGESGGVSSVARAPLAEVRVADEASVILGGAATRENAPERLVPTHVRRALRVSDEEGSAPFVGPLPIANPEANAPRFDLVNDGLVSDAADLNVSEVAETAPQVPSPPIEAAVPSTINLIEDVLSNSSAEAGTTEFRTVDLQPAGPDVAGAPVQAAPRSNDGGLRAWIVRVLSVRDAIAALPPVPTPLWFGGAVLLVMLSIWRRCAGLLWLRHAAPADPHVQAVVRQIGETLGLERIPRVVFVDSAVSPMIWCGLRPTLVLPRGLWRTLDEDSRRAVLVHELAHVRRWDHLLCWLEAGVGALYWWHPIVWWARRRLHEEADASCDAWVTSLFPANRRAYASALLVTKSFVSSRAESRGPWLGVASGSAKRLARRITMVMTHKAAPRMSTVGMCVTALVLATGTFVMPGLACPPVEDEVKTKSGQQRVYVTKPAKKAAQEGAPASPGVTFFGEAPALEAMRGQPEADHAPAPHPLIGVPVPPHAPAPAHAPKAPKPPKAPKAPREPGVPMVAPMAPARAQPAQPLIASTDLEALKEGRTPREYRLSPGKLQAFYGMMSRNDVPILVQMSDDHIVIWGNDDEHAVFTKFVRIVEGPDARAPRGMVALRGEQLSALAKVDAERAARDAAAGERNQWMNKAADQSRKTSERVVRDRVAMAQAAEKARAEAEEARERAEEFRELAQELRGRAQGMSQEDRKELEEAARSLRSRSDALQSGSKSLEQAVKDLERQIRVLEERAEKLEKDRGDSGQNRTPLKRKAPAAPGMLASLEAADAPAECEQPCEASAGGGTSKSASR